MTVKTFSDGSYLEYADGNFDSWCVYMVNPAKNFRRPPKDVDYFDFLQKKAQQYGSQKVYGDFVLIYDLTQKTISPQVLSKIDEISASYGNDALDFSKIYTILYMGMLAEENKAFTKLGKRIKRLGVHLLLLEGQPVQYAANFMRGMNWRQIDSMCKQRGF